MNRVQIHVKEEQHKRDNTKNVTTTATTTIE